MRPIAAFTRGEVAIATGQATEWVARLAEDECAGTLAETIRLGRFPLLVVDEVGDIRAASGPSHTTA